MSGMSQVGYIILGWLLGILSMLLAKYIQTRDDKRKKEIEILSDTLKYLFKTKQTYNNLLIDKSALAKVAKKFPEKAPEFERKMYECFDREIKNEFFPDLMFHSFQLRRLEDGSFWKDFEIVMNEYEKLGKMIFDLPDMDGILKQRDQIIKLMSSFTDKCNAKSKV